MSATRILSGVRPTGNIHLGNYLGAIKQWVSLSKTIDEHLFCIVDQHALTTSGDAENLRKNTLTIAAAYIACGIDPKTSHIFVQSHVPAHTELAWYFACTTPMGWLSRMTQFKDKAHKNKDQTMLGLFAYPVLMAADILLYQTTHVPVGDDQKQHVELARDIAQAFNHHYDANTFTMPEPMIQKSCARVMSLRDGTKKMSKSDISDYSRIHLLDDADAIRLKIKKAKSDADVLHRDMKIMGDRPEAFNLLSIYADMSNISLEDACGKFHEHPFSALKNDLADALIAKLSPIREQILDLLNHEDHLIQILKNGSTRANEISQNTLRHVRKTLGMLPV